MKATNGWAMGDVYPDNLVDRAVGDVLEIGRSGAHIDLPQFQEGDRFKLTNVSDGDITVGRIPHGFDGGLVGPDGVITLPPGGSIEHTEPVKPKPGWLWREQYRTDAGDDEDIEPRFSELIPGKVLDENQIVAVDWNGYPGWVVITFLARGGTLPQ
jgi:hypothetical protein